MEEKIEIHKVRDFSGVFSDSINFIKHNFKSIGKSLVVIVAPMYTLATILVSFLSVRIIDVMDNSQRTFTTYGNAGRDKVLALFLDPTLWLAILAYLLAFLLAIGVVFSYIKLYGEKEAGEEITPNMVWQATWRKTLKFLGYSIIYGILFTIAYFLLILVLTLVAFVPILGAIIMFLTLLTLFVCLYTYITVLLPVIFYEDEGIMETLSRTVSLLKGSFWQTLLINIVAYLLVQTIASGLYFVFMFIFQTSSLGIIKYDRSTLQIIFIVFFTIMPLVLFFTYLFQYSISSFNYYSLLEKRDHVGLKMKVSAISDNEQSNPAEEY